MHPLRYNLFHQIHQGLRALLYHASLTVQQTDFTNASATAELKKLLEELLFLFDGHAHTEDNLVFTMIQEQAPELVAGFEAQHEEDAQLGIALHNAIAQLGIAVTADEKIIAGQSIQKALNAFTAFNLTHMAAEEGIVKETIWLYYSDEELHRKTAEIVAGLDPAKNARYSFWMLKGLGPTRS